MLCNQCGRRTYKGEKFCPKCGAPMPERPTLEEELKMSQRFKRTNAGSVQDYSEEPSSAQSIEPTSLETENDEIFTPALQFDAPADKEKNASDTGFYGSFGVIANDSIPPEKSADPEPEDFSPVFSTDDPSDVKINNDDFNLDFSLTEENITLPSSYSPSTDDNDDLVIPDFVADQKNYTEKKSMGYEVTVKIPSASKSDDKKKPIREAIPEGLREIAKAPRVIQPKVVASGTVTSRNDLPPLREGEMYVALNHRQLRRLRSRSFRGLGILCTLCLVIISTFCIWNYTNSFADPLVGRWKGNVESQAIPIEALKEIGQDSFDSTWEFNDGGSMYLNLVMKEMPVSFSGTYEEKTDEKGEQYLTLSLTNPMDGETYSFMMYYTITGQVLEFNDMEGFGMTITLQKE